MKKVIILGAKVNGRGLGPRLISACESKGIEVNFIPRWMVDLGKEGWFDRVDFSSVDTVIVNAYDHKNPSTQIDVFKKLFSELKNEPTVQLVVIGSTFHYLNSVTAEWQEYVSAKQELYNYFMEIALPGNYDCRLFLFEPGLLGTENIDDNFCLRFEDATNILFKMIDMNLKFCQMSLMGNHPPNK